MVFDDPITKTIDLYIHELNQLLADSNDFFDILNSFGNYDHSLRRPTAAFQGTTSVQVYENLSDRLSKFNNFLFEMTERQSINDSNRIFSLVNNQRCTIESVMFFINEVRSLINKYHEFFGFPNSRINANYESKSGNITKNKNKITITKDFKKTVTPSDSKFHYVYSNHDGNEYDQFKKIPVNLKNIKSTFSRTPTVFGSRGRRLNFRIRKTKKFMVLII